LLADRLASLAERARLGAPRAAAWILGALIVLQLITFGRSWVADAHGTSSVAAGRPASRMHLPMEALAKQIIAAELFGSAARPASGARDGADPPADQYALKGVVNLGSSGDGFAILAARDRKSRTFRTGESIVTGLVLHEVGSDYVLLQDSAQLKRLTLPHGSLLASLAPALSPAGDVPEAGANLSTDTRATLEAFGLSVIQDGSGAISGLSGRGSESWHRSGLLPSDVIIAIDGTPVGDVLRQPYAIDRASVAAVTTLTVLRDGVSTDIEAEPGQTQSAQLVRRRRAGS
jgi:hypothetical protein